jgi:Rieske Fe-S protein
MSEDLHSETASDVPQASRRTVLEAAIAVLGAGVTFAVGIPVVGVLVSPLQSKLGKENWVAIAPEDQVAEGQTVRVVYKRVKKDGWMKSETPATVYVSKQGEDLRVLSSVCSHLGCSVNWDDKAHQFKCPCHNGVYSSEGKVVSGPPPRPLTQLQARVKDGQIEVLEA